MKTEWDERRINRIKPDPQQWKQQKAEELGAKTGVPWSWFSRHEQLVFRPVLRTDAAEYSVSPGVVDKVMEALGARTARPESKHLSVSGARTARPESQFLPGYTDFLQLSCITNLSLRKVLAAVLLLWRADKVLFTRNLMGVRALSDEEQEKGHARIG